MHHASILREELRWDPRGRAGGLATVRGNHYPSPGIDMSTRPVAIVTAASRGIGAACARQLSADGYDVAVMSRSEAVHSVAEEIDGFPFQGDLTSAQDIARFVQAVKERWGRLDVLVNSAGDAARGDLETLPDDAWLGGFELLFMSVLRASREALPLMRSSGGGSPVASGNVRTGCRRGLLPLQRRWIVSQRRESSGGRWVVEGTVR